ncbi:early nodulin-like protein 3 [Gastrolobium bilobum]|uniref:early nodulin-like protein 3 n=1 Tax=Gastrolobium bilobum TaxID=150636 RepID=UPI002AB1E5BA|nr:early nodulin-like protein 3 [Gastrolobium bilobum]
MAQFLGLMLLMIPMLLLSSSSSYQATANKFDVGGKDGWVVKPSEDYNHWAQRNRFQVNDTLNFKYKKGNDSVLVVKKEDYDLCNINNPMHKMDDGNSTFHLDKSGLFFFISGNSNNCKNGQKLVVLVMAVRHQLPPAAPPSQSPASALPDQQVHVSGFTSPAPSPSKASGSARLGGSVSMGVGLGVILFLTGFAGWTCYPSTCRHLGLYLSNNIPGTSPTVDSFKLEVDAPDEEEDGQRRRKKPRRVQVKESLDQGEIFKVLPLKIIIHVYEDEDYVL